MLNNKMHDTMKFIFPRSSSVGYAFAENEETVSCTLEFLLTSLKHNKGHTDFSKTEINLLQIEQLPGK